MTPADKPDLPAPDVRVNVQGYETVQAYSCEMLLRLLADERRKARAEMIAEMESRPVAWRGPNGVIHFSAPPLTGEIPPYWEALALIPDTKE